MASMRKMKGKWYARIVVYLGYYMLKGKKKQQQKEIREQNKLIMNEKDKMERERKRLEGGC